MACPSSKNRLVSTFIVSNKICGCSKIINDKLNGRAVIFDSKTDNIVYEGEWYNNKKQGIGILYNKYGNLEYDGEWMDDMKNGIGILYYPNNQLNSNTFFHSYENDSKNKKKIEKGKYRKI